MIMINNKFCISIYNLIKLFLFQGYYMNNDVFGQAGDFITSPEISQVFGEVLCFPRKLHSLPCPFTQTHNIHTTGFLF